MPQQHSKFPPGDSDFGIIDTDTDRSKVNPPNLTNALNTHFVAKDRQLSRARSIVIGNTNVAFISSTEAQNKRYRLNIPQVAGTHTVKVVLSPGKVYTYTYAQGGTAHLTYTALETATATALAAETYTLTPAGDYLTAILAITTVSYVDYYVYIDGVEQTVTQESVDPLAAGLNYVVGSYDMNGDLFVWSTATSELPTTITATITAVVNNGVGNPKMTTSAAHGLITGQKVRLSTTVAGYNGIWTIFVNNSTHFELYYCAYTATATGTITTYVDALGEIGVMTYNPSDGTPYVYTRLVRAKGLNFRTIKQIDAKCAKDSYRISIYYTDFYNRPSLMYYYGAYSLDGAIQVIRAQGTYEYSTISDETSLMLPAPQGNISFFDQITGGGQTLSGNWYYAYRLATATFDTTAPSDLINPVNNYSANQDGDPELIVGDTAFTLTPKANILQVIGLTPGLYAYVELLGVNDSGGALAGYRITRIPLSPSQSSINITHTGFETDTTLLSAAELNILAPNYNMARSIDLLDSRCVMSCLKGHTDPDLTAWCSAINYTIKQDVSLSSVGAITTSITYGEYQDPVNVNSRVGYMDNETYRFGIKLKYIDTGAWTNVYWLWDVKFDTSGASGQRLGGLGVYDLTTTSAGFTSAPNPRYLEVVGIDMDYIIPVGNDGAGKRIKDIFSQVSIERSECVPEILFSGMVRLSTNSAGVKTFGTFPTNALLTYDLSANQDRKHLLLYTPDNFLGGADLQSPGLELLNYGAPYYSNYADVSGIVTLHVREYSCDLFGQPNYQAVNITASTYIQTGQTGSVGGTGFSLGNVNYQNAGGYGLKVSADLLNIGVSPDSGFYYVQIRRAIINKYGDHANTKYITTETFISTIDHDSSDTFDVFGGDVFIQKTFFHNDYLTPSTGTIGNGTGFYTQNRINSQMRFVDTTSQQAVFPAYCGTATTLATKMKFWLEDYYLQEQLNYQHGYDVNNNIQLRVAYDAALPQSSDYPTRIIFSASKPQGSVSDPTRIFLPLAFRDLNLSDGEIVHHRALNGELFTWQNKAFMRQFFQTRATMNTSDGNEVLLGDSAVMSRQGVVISTYGCGNKWAIVIGRSVGGNDTAYWISTFYNSLIRFAGDGTRNENLPAFFNSFFEGNLKWLIGVDTPAHGEGICGVWDEFKKDAIFTVRGQKIVGAWIAGTTYEANQYAKVPVLNPSTFQSTANIYRSRLSSNTGHAPASSPTWWELVAHSDTNFYNEYTLAFTEIKNGIVNFTSPLPKIYLQWRNTYLTQRPFELTAYNTSWLYLNNVGGYAKWYDLEGLSQSEDGFIEWVFNPDLMLIKQYLGLVFNSDIVPYKVELSTPDHSSFLLAADFEQQIDEFFAAIKNDTITSSDGASNDQDTSRLWGQRLTVQFYFQKQVWQSLREVTLKWFGKSRGYNQ